MSRLWLTLALLPALACSRFSSAAARSYEDTTEVEFYAGAYLPKPDILDPAFAFGLRGARNISENYQILLGFGYARSDGDIESDAGQIDLELTLTFIDLSLAYNILPRNRWVTKVHGGLGWGFADLVADFQPGDPAERFVEGLREDSFSLQFGLGGKYDLNRTWGVVPDARWRWFERRDGGDLDFEVTLAVAYTSGP